MDDANEQPVAPLVEVDDPAKLTNKDINDLTGDGLKDEDGPNRDAADALKKSRDEAKSGEEPERGYFHGQGGGAGDV